MTLSEDLAPKSLNLCGLRCPHLLISVIAAIRNLDPNQHIQIRATDLNAPSSISAWSRQSGNELLDMYQEGECFVFLLKRTPQNVTYLNKNGVTPAKKEAGRELIVDS